MAIQTANLGAAPSGAGGDTFRSAATKFNENFTNNAHAASRLVGTQAGNVMEVGAFGLGGDAPTASINSIKNNGFYNNLDPISNSYQWGNYIEVSGGGGGGQIYFGAVESNLIYARTRWGENWAPMRLLLHTGNTATDANGFIKAASPIVKLFADKIEINDEARQQDISFEKLGVGDYLIKGSSGFAHEGWYIETPKDANGNVLFSVIYAALENGDISIKTHKKKFDLETASIVADLTQPIDITENRWIDIRLQALPPIEYEMPTSKTPADFQPTGIAQAVSEMMNGAEQ